MKDTGDDSAMVTTVIYDGTCDFCKSCVKWVKARAEISAIPNQSIEPSEYGITREDCEKSVVVITDKTYIAAKAVAILLNQTGHRFLASALIYSGLVGELGYKYVASHRNGILVKILHWLIKKSL